MFKTLRNAWAIPELRRKLLFTLFIVFLYRVGAALPIPFINYTALDSAAEFYGTGIFSYLNILSGYAFSSATLLALSVTPYINASIIMQLSEGAAAGELDMRTAAAWADASGGFACFCLGGTYLEKSKGDKYAQVKRYCDYYLANQ